MRYYVLPSELAIDGTIDRSIDRSIDSEGTFQSPAVDGRDAPPYIAMDSRVSHSTVERLKKTSKEISTLRARYYVKKPIGRHMKAMSDVSARTRRF